MNSIVIFAAGRGTRLGASVPKFVVEVDSRPIFLHQFRALSHVPGEIYIVCGYRAALLIQLMLADLAPDEAARSRLTFVYNDQFTAPQCGSIARVMAAIPQNRPALFIDGDMLFAAQTAESLIAEKHTTVALRAAPTADAVMATLDGEGRLRRFARGNDGAGEWANLAFYQPRHLPLLAEIASSGVCRHHFEVINELVVRGVSVNTHFAEFAEVDDVDDLRSAAQFVRECQHARD
jgi:CTP:molybdopterin cytidylyltransferase MocA